MAEGENAVRLYVENPPASIPLYVEKVIKFCTVRRRKERHFLYGEKPRLSRGLEEIFYSSAHLQQALTEGNNVLKQIDVGQIKNNATRDAVNRYKLDFEFYTTLGEKWTDGIARHPIYIYSMVRDLYKLRKLEKSLPSDVDVKDLPTIGDLNGTALALVRLQYTYDLETDDMVAGIIAGERSVELTPEDCYFIGKQAQEIKIFDQAIEWFNKALSFKSATKRALKRKIYSNKRSCENQFRLMRNEVCLKTENIWWRFNKTCTESTRMNDEKKYQYASEHVERFEAYRKLCKGGPTHDEYKNITELSKLKCRFYDNNRHPLLIMQPARVEDVNSDPHMKIFRDILTTKEMENIRELSMPKLMLSKVFKVETQNGTEKIVGSTSKSRISKGYFFNSTRPECKELQRKLYKRIEAITGLCAISYESFQQMLSVAFLSKPPEMTKPSSVIQRGAGLAQNDAIRPVQAVERWASSGLERIRNKPEISNYGIGGYYYSHFDWTPRHKDPHHNERIATLLLYLNGVVAGGATVFPRIGVRMLPSVGDGIFWYNLKRNTLGDENTMHAGCPVLLGTKWVSNVWIGRHHQEFIRPCTLNEDE